MNENLKKLAQIIDTQFDALKTDAKENTVLECTEKVEYTKKIRQKTRKKSDFGKMLKRSKSKSYISAADLHLILFNIHSVYIKRIEYYLESNTDIKLSDIYSSLVDFKLFTNVNNLKSTRFFENFFSENTENQRVEKIENSDNPLNAEFCAKIGAELENLCEKPKNSENLAQTKKRTRGAGADAQKKAVSKPVAEKVEASSIILPPEKSDATEGLKSGKNETTEIAQIMDKPAKPGKPEKSEVDKAFPDAVDVWDRYLKSKCEGVGIQWEGSGQEPKALKGILSALKKSIEDKGNIASQQVIVEAFTVFVEKFEQIQDGNFLKKLKLSLILSNLNEIISHIKNNERKSNNRNVKQSDNERLLRQLQLATERGFK